MNPVKKSIMLHQFDHCRERTVAEWAVTLRLGGIDCLKVKTCWANHWMSSAYSHPLVPNGPEALQRLYEAFGAEGITLVPWLEPRGRNVVGEAAIAVAAARACGGIVETDLEVGDASGFWNVQRFGNAGIIKYCQLIKDAGVTHYVDTACFEGWMEALAIPRIAPEVDRLLCQSYWIGFEKPYAEVISHDVATLLAAGAREVGVIGDARAERHEMLAAADFAQTLGAVEWSCWAADMATPETYAGFQFIPGEPYLDTENGDLTDTQRDVLRRALTEQYRIVHDLLHPLARAAGFGATVEAYVGTYDQQLNDIKAVFPDLF